MATYKRLDYTGLAYFWGKIKAAIAEKQDKLVSGTSIKTINGTSVLGNGDISVQPVLTAGTGIRITNNVISVAYTETANQYGTTVTIG